MPIWGELSQIMPEPGEVAPLFGGFVVGPVGEHLGGEFSCEVGDFVEVAVLGVEFITLGAIFAGEGGTVRREERLPLFFGASFFAVGVESHQGGVLFCYRFFDRLFEFFFRFGEFLFLGAGFSEAQMMPIRFPIVQVEREAGKEEPAGSVGVLDGSFDTVARAFLKKAIGEGEIEARDPGTAADWNGGGVNADEFGAGGV